MPQGAKLQIYSVYKPTEFMIQWACVIKKDYSNSIFVEKKA